MVQGIDGNYYAGQSDLNGIATFYQYDQNILRDKHRRGRET